MQAVAAHFSATTLFRPLYLHRRKEATGQPERSIEMTKQQDQAVNVLVGMALLARTPISASGPAAPFRPVRSRPGPAASSSRCSFLVGRLLLSACAGTTA